MSPLNAAPLRQPPLRLDDLLRDVTAENLHGEIDTGPSVGSEGWWQRLGSARPRAAYKPKGWPEMSGDGFRRDHGAWRLLAKFAAIS